MKIESNLRKLIESVVSNAERRGYSQSTINGYKQVFGMLKKFCVKNNIAEYSEEVGKCFIEAKHNQAKPVCKAGMHRYETTIQRLDCALAGVEWEPTPKKRSDLATSCFDDIVCEYEKYLQQTGKTDKNIRRRMIIVARFLAYLDVHGCKQLKYLTAKLIYGAFCDAPGNKYPFRISVNAFLKYAKIYGLTDSDFSQIIPPVTRHFAVASVYTPEEVEQLLASIDRSRRNGKRDYAVALIAARLGLRASDIAALTFDNLNLDKGTIEIYQVKTKGFLSLPLLDEVKTAIFDYIDNGRPESDERCIFLNEWGRGVLMPAGVGDIVRKNLKSSGVDYGTRRTGSHALRSSLATALRSDGVDYYTIQKILGHFDIQSTKVYAKTDVEQLRTNALPVPPTAGAFYDLLYSSHLKNKVQNSNILESVILGMLPGTKSGGRTL